MAQPRTLPVRLAIVVEQPSVTKAADLLTAELSKRADLQLLERAEIDRVYREQALSAGNRDYLKLGQVLGADGLVLLESLADDTNDFLSVRLVAVKPGVLLAEERFAWPIANLAEWSSGLARHLGPLLPKLTVLAKDAVPISVVNLRSTLPSVEARDLERQLTLLAIERLSRERQVFMLERRKLEALSEEKTLAGMDESAFWNGSYLLEGTIDRDGYSPSTVTLSARLVPPRGGAASIIELSGSRTNLAALIDQLARRVLSELRLTANIRPWSPADEADQYYQEADWALRQGLHERAQRAGEAAWSLGLHDRSLALLRVRAYGDDVVAPEMPRSCSLEVPAVPDPARLPVAIRALQLFCEDAPATSTNAPTLDPDWFNLGCRSLRMAVRFLGGFYYTAESRPGNESALADLRARARQTAALLQTAAPKDRFQQSQIFVPWSSSSMAECETLEWLIWEHGGVWQERPENALPGLTRLLENGFHPSNLPRLFGWSWEDRKGVPAMLRRFIGQLGASTNPAVRLESGYLALLRVPDGAENEIEREEKKLFAQIWDERRWVLADPGRVWMLDRVEEVLRRRKYAWAVGTRLQDPPLMEFAQRLRKDYLLTSSNYNVLVFNRLFLERTGYYSAPEAQELLPLLEEFTARTRPAQQIDPTNRIAIAREMTPLTRISNLLYRVAGTNQFTGRRSGPAALWPAANPLKVELTAWKVSPSALHTELGLAFTGTRIRQERIWSCVEYGSSRSLTPPPRVFACADLRTGAGDAIVFPPEFSHLENFFDPIQFEVVDDSLFASSKGRLMRYRFADRTWSEVAVPLQGEMRMMALRGHLYVSATSSLVELEPDSGAVHVLASSLRRPAVNELDTLWSGPSLLFPRTDGRLGVWITNRLFALDPVHRTWSTGVTVFPVSPGPFGDRVFFSDAGAFWLRPSTTLNRIVALWNDQSEPELLLAQWRPGMPRAATTPPPSRWTWPEPFRLDFPLYVPEGRTLWAVQPVRLQWFPGQAEEPNAFQDGRTVTLLLFDPDHAECRFAALTLEKDGQPCDPFGAGLIGPIPIAYCLANDSGIVIASPRFAGHWLIPKSLLEPRLAPLPAATAIGNRNTDKPAAAGREGGSGGSTNRRAGQ